MELTEGVHEVSSGHDAHTNLVISRVLANTASLPRFFDKPEVVYITGSSKIT